MTPLYGSSAGGAWEYVIRRPPTSEILGYLVEKWKTYEGHYSGVGQPFAERDEPALTEGLAAFLEKEKEEGRQPFDGDFYAELKRYDLGPDGKRKIVGRTDIEWRLSEIPAFTIEFKVIGNGRPARAYVADGMARFVDGRYGHRSMEGAMWAFIRPNSKENRSHIEAIIDQELAALCCLQENGAHRVAPSVLAPLVASFDSLHQRNAPVPHIRLAHIFVDIL